MSETSKLEAEGSLKWKCMRGRRGCNRKEAGNGLHLPAVEDAGGKEPSGSCSPKGHLDRWRRMKSWGLE